MTRNNFMSESPYSKTGKK